MNRRKFLGLAGGGIILAAGTGMGIVATRRPTAALEPWELAGSAYSEPRKRALSYAILAPNPHNQQPWLVDLSTPGEIILLADTSRLLPHTDPYNRQITIGLGCFLEILKMAAAEDGYDVALELFPKGSNDFALDNRPVAIARFEKSVDVRSDPLFAHVLTRSSSKEPYNTGRPVSEATLANILSAAQNGTIARGHVDLEKVRPMRELTTAALRVEIETPRTYKESVDLFRIGKEEVEANPDGIDFSGPFFETLSTLGMFTRESALDTSSSVYQEGIAAVVENTQTAMGHMWQISLGNSRIDQINTGRDWVRLNLAATANGVATQPLSQALQEYPEMSPYYKQVHDVLAPEGGTVQMLARVGYRNEIQRSPRWPLEAKLIG